MAEALTGPKQAPNEDLSSSVAPVGALSVCPTNGRLGTREPGAHPSVFTLGPDAPASKAWWPWAPDLLFLPPQP